LYWYAKDGVVEITKELETCTRCRRRYTANTNMNGIVPSPVFFI
jgi:hypothetical protein